MNLQQKDCIQDDDGWLLCQVSGVKKSTCCDCGELVKKVKEKIGKIKAGKMGNLGKSVRKYLNLWTLILFSLYI